MSLNAASTAAMSSTISPLVSSSTILSPQEEREQYFKPHMENQERIEASMAQLPLTEWSRERVARWAEVKRKHIGKMADLMEHLNLKMRSTVATAAQASPALLSASAASFSVASANLVKSADKVASWRQQLSFKQSRGALHRQQIIETFHEMERICGRTKRDDLRIILAEALKAHDARQACVIRHAQEKIDFQIEQNALNANRKHGLGEEDEVMLRKQAEERKARHEKEETELAKELTVYETKKLLDLLAYDPLQRTLWATANARGFRLTNGAISDLEQSLDQTLPADLIKRAELTASIRQGTTSRVLNKLYRQVGNTSSPRLEGGITDQKRNNSDSEDDSEDDDDDAKDSFGTIEQKDVFEATRQHPLFQHHPHFTGAATLLLQLPKTTRLEPLLESHLRIPPPVTRELLSSHFGSRSIEVAPAYIRGGVSNRAAAPPVVTHAALPVTAISNGPTQMDTSD